MQVKIIGAGLAGCEAALWLADRGVQVKLYEQKPAKYSPAHKSAGFAELICSNSLKAERPDSASGLLKIEMKMMGSHLLDAAETARVAAGGALAVDRDVFSTAVTEMVENHPNITVRREEVTALDESAPVLVASGPLTEGALAQAVAALTGDHRLSFYDAVAPIVTAESLDYDKVFAASRYGRGEADYLNCPFNKEEYEAFHAALIAAERAPLHDFDGDLTVYEGCMPIEVMAARGADTIRFGPLRPVGLRDPRTGHRPWAAVQLRAENTARTRYNLVGLCLQKLSQPDACLSVVVNRVPVDLPLNRISHFENRLHKVYATLTDGSVIPLSQKLSAILESVSEQEIFLRCHQSYIVNLAHVHTLEDSSFQMEDGTSIPISRAFYKEAKNAYYHYRLR